MAFLGIISGMFTPVISKIMCFMDKESMCGPVETILKVNLWMVKWGRGKCSIMGSEFMEMGILSI